MTISVRQTDNATILDVKGPLKAGEAEGLRDKVRELLDAGFKNLAINMAAVPFIDSWGLAIMVFAHISTSRAGAKCKFFAVSAQVRQVLKMVFPVEVLSVYDDEATALGSFQQGSARGSTR